VFALCGFHSYIVSLNLTTQEKLKHVYDVFPRSPFSYGGCFTNWVKVVLCPKRAKSRVSQALYIQTNEPERFKKMRS